LKPSLSRVATRSATLPDRIVLYGPPGWGKTSFAARMPAAIFLMTPGEDRLKKLIAEGLAPETAHFPELAESWHDVLFAVEELLEQPHDYKTFVLDTGNGAEVLAQQDVCLSNFGGDWTEAGFNGFGRGEKITMNRLWTPFLTLLDKLREKRQMRIVLCCHATIRNTKNPEGQDYDKIEPGMSKPGWGVTAKWADMILCGALEVAVKKESKIAHGKATGGRARLLHTSPTAAVEAKNCHRLPPTIRLGEDPLRAFDAFRAAFPQKPARNGNSRPQEGRSEEGSAKGHAERKMGEGAEAGATEGGGTATG
jgi:hypothetical protein